MVLKQVHDTNMRAKGHPERVFSVNQSPSPPSSQALQPQPHPAPAFPASPTTFSLNDLSQGIASTPCPHLATGLKLRHPDGAGKHRLCDC